MNTRQFINRQIQDAIEVKQRLLADAKLMETLEQVAEITLQAYQRQQKTLFAGNGGSAADAQHLAAELVNRFHFDRPGIPAIALTTDSSVLTSIANDYGYHYIYARQIEALGNKGDVFFAISTSGNSENMLHALRSCHQLGLTSIGLCGKNGGKMKDLCDYCVIVPEQETARIQECHILIGHILCDYVEQQLFARKPS